MHSYLCTKSNTQCQDPLKNFFLTTFRPLTLTKITARIGSRPTVIVFSDNRIFPRILPFGPEGPKWQDCFDTFCARAQKVQNKGWRSTA